MMAESGVKTEHDRTLPWISLACALVVAALAYRLILIHLYPTFFGWDGFTRLWDPGKLFVRHWLPIPQLPIYLAHLIGADIVAIRVAYAVVGTAAIALVGLFAIKEHGDRLGLATLALVATVPGFAWYTIVPYQEGFLSIGLFGFLCAWNPESRREEVSPAARGTHVLAATALAVACACRYEAWVFAGLFAFRPIFGRRFQELWVFVPSGFVILAWLVVLPSIDSTNPMATTPLLSEHLSALRLVWDILERWAIGVNGVALVIALVGAGVAFRRGGVLGRELLAFLAFLVMLATLRAIQSGATSPRMALMVIVLTTLYIPIGLGLVVDRLPSAARSTALATVVVLLVGWYGSETIAGLDQRTRKYELERIVALQLEDLASQTKPGARIGIVPRTIKNSFGEDSVKVIFGHSMKLLSTDPRWVFGAEQVKRESANISYFLFFDEQTRLYQILQPRPTVSLGKAPSPR